MTMEDGNRPPQVQTGELARQNGTQKNFGAKDAAGSNPLSAPNADLCDALIAAGIIQGEAAQRARLVHNETGEAIEAVLTRLGMVSEERLGAFLAEASGLPLVAPDAFPDHAIAAQQLTVRFLRDQRALPLAEEGAALTVAFANPLDPYARDAIAFATGRPVMARVALPSDIDAALERLYGHDEETGSEDAYIDDEDLERMKDLASDAPVIRAVNRLIIRAGELQASDIHLEPAEDSLAVRFRIDGVMREMDPLPAAMKQALVSRIKVMAGLDIAERRLPQDGRLRLAVRGQDIDLRVATSPTIHGESVVMRLLDRSNVALDFKALGYTERQAAQLIAAVRKPHGIVLVTGPTGSGKTTTLYAALSVLNTPERKLLTVEDPIEYRLPGVTQTQVQPGIGLSFAAALRSFLRQDPDVIMVGEIRDLETAQVAIQAALTGHMILSTLHTNSAASAVTRLIDMGVEPFLITSTLEAVLAQRLVRRLCPHCSRPAGPAEEVLDAAGIDMPVHAGMDFREAVGCPSCGGSGFKGRLALMELLPMNEAVSHLVLARAEDRTIEEAAHIAGMQSMLADGVAKAGAGLTTLGEVLRVTREI